MSSILNFGSSCANNVTAEDDPNDFGSDRDEADPEEDDPDSNPPDDDDEHENDNNGNNNSGTARNDDDDDDDDNDEETNNNDRRRRERPVTTYQRPRPQPRPRGRASSGNVDKENDVVNSFGEVPHCPLCGSCSSNLIMQRGSSAKPEVGAQWQEYQTCSCTLEPEAATGQEKGSHGQR